MHHLAESGVRGLGVRTPRDARRVVSVRACSRGVQDARIAAQELMVRNHWGHPVTVEPAARSDGERALGRQLHATLNRWT